jgi:hypothetical protein
VPVAFFTGESFHAGGGKIRAKFGDIWCRKSAKRPEKLGLDRGKERNGERISNLRFEISKGRQQDWRMRLWDCD